MRRWMLERIVGVSVNSLLNELHHHTCTKGKSISSNNKDLGSINDLDFRVCLPLVFTAHCSHFFPIASYKIHSL